MLADLLTRGAPANAKTAARLGGRRTNQTPCTNLTTAVFADLVRAAQSTRASPPRLKRLAPESSPCRKRARSRDPRWFVRRPPRLGGVAIGHRRCAGLERQQPCRPTRPRLPVRPGDADVLCQPPHVLADVGLPSSASRSALRAAGSVTAAPAIRWVAARSGRGPDELGMVTVMCCCRPRCLAGS